MSISEATIERELKKRVNEAGGLCLKLIGYRGIPDRMVLLPTGKVIFVEVKQAKGKIAPAQTVWHKMLKQLGFQVEVIWSCDDIDKLSLTKKDS
jgi:G:T-mismatch repair DNA endonuclease (very short patch repair protein)